MADTMFDTPVEQPISMMEELTCDICRELLYQSLTITPCFHIFCGHCLAASSKHTPITSCPGCRGRVTGALQDHKIERQLGRFLAANPGFKHSPKDAEAFEKEYKHGEVIDGIPNMVPNLGYTAPPSPDFTMAGFPDIFLNEDTAPSTPDSAIAVVPDMVPNDGNTAPPSPGDFTLQGVQDELEHAEDHAFARQTISGQSHDHLETALRALDEASGAANHTHSEWVNRSLADRQGGLQVSQRVAYAEAECVEADALLRFTILVERAQVRNERLIRALRATRRVRDALDTHVVRERDQRFERLRQRRRRRGALIARSSRAVRRSTSST